jgi:hypothetical protein
MWEPQPLATLRASTACMGITLTFTTSMEKNIQQYTVEESKRVSTMYSDAIHVTSFLTFSKISSLCFRFSGYYFLTLNVRQKIILHKALDRFNATSLKG